MFNSIFIFSYVSACKQNLQINFGWSGLVVIAPSATLAKVKSSAMTARQPSVPNLICATRRDWHSGLYMPSIAVQPQMNAD
jgi:hypothetical protein